MHDVKLNSHSATDDAVMQLPGGKMALCVCFTEDKEDACVCVCQGRWCPPCCGDVCGRGPPVKRAHGKITINV